MNHLRTVFLAAGALLLAGWVSCAIAADPGTARAAPPNVIFILADDKY